MIDLAPQNAYGLQISHPLVAAAGFLGDVAETARLFGLQRDASGGIALAVTRRVVVERGAGRAARFIETAGGAVFLPGESAVPLRRVEQGLADAWAELAVPVIVSVGGTDARDVIAALDGLPGIAGFELTSAESDTAKLQRSISDLRRRSELPLLVRLAGLHGSLTERAQAAAAGGADCLALLSEIPAAALDAQQRLQRGELLGPAAFPFVLAAAERVLSACDLPLIAGAGVHYAGQVRTLLNIGVRAVSLDSLLLRGPSPLRALLQEIQAAAVA